MEMQKLTVHAYGETAADDKRITISPGNTNSIIADMEDCQVQGRTLRHVVVLYMDGGAIDLTVDHADLDKLESVIGAYCFE